MADCSPLAWNGASLKQTLSLARSCLDAADVLAGRDAELSATLRTRATSYIQAVLSVDQPDLDKCLLWTSFSPDGTPTHCGQAWAGNRGQPCTARFAGDLLDAAVAIQDDRGLELVSRVARIYHEQMIPREMIVRAGDPGAVIALAGELYRLTGAQAWLDTALAHATDAIELFFDCPLPRMALGRNHYEAQQGSSVLVHALARLVLIAEGKPLKGGLKRIMV